MSRSQLGLGLGLGLWPAPARVGKLRSIRISVDRRLVRDVLSTIGIPGTSEDDGHTFQFPRPCPDHTTQQVSITTTADHQSSPPILARKQRSGPERVQRLVERGLARRYTRDHQRP